MTKLQDQFEKRASLTQVWHSKQTDFAKEGIPFKLVWNYPWDLKLSNGRYIRCNNYADHHLAVKEACYYYKQTGRKSPYIT